jgi:aminopeptidase N
LLLFTVACAINTRADDLLCANVLRAMAPISSSEYRKYAPDREVDMLHLAIDVTPNFKERSLSAETVLRFKPLRSEIREIRLNAEDLRVSELSSSAPVAHWQNTGTEIVITFAEALPSDSEQTVTVRYKAFPEKGIYFRTEEMGYSAEDEHLFSQGEDSDARYWIPCYDSPNDKLTSEVTCHVPEKMTVLSNGHLVSEEDESGGMKAVHWLQDKPHTTYLISLVAGNFKKIEDKHNETPLAFYTPASQIDLAPNSFKETKEIMDFFENEIGVPYPWDKYYQVCVQDFVAGGMENTSVTTLTDRTLHPDETEPIRDSQGLVAHEMAHQWFGDLVTCKDWSQIWLNEGFATFYANLYNLHKDGRNDFLYGLFNSCRTWIDRSVAEDSRPVVFRRYDKAGEMFGFLVYPKAGWVLHMLRCELGPDVYRRGVKTYLERYKFQNVVTHQFMAVMEEVSGRSLDRFFDQWIFHPHFPELKASYSWDAKQKLARISIEQVQQLTNDVALFQFPLVLRFNGAFGRVTNTVQIADEKSEFFIPLPGAPDVVRIDPDYELLAKISFEPPRSMVLAAL